MTASGLPNLWRASSGVLLDKFIHDALDKGVFQPFFNVPFRHSSSTTISNFALLFKRLGKFDESYHSRQPGRFNNTSQTQFQKSLGTSIINSELAALTIAHVRVPAGFRDTEKHCAWPHARIVPRTKKRNIADTAADLGKGTVSLIHFTVDRNIHRVNSVFIPCRCRSGQSNVRAPKMTILAAGSRLSR